MHLQPPASGEDWTCTTVFSFPIGVPGAELVTLGPDGYLYGSTLYTVIPVYPNGSAIFQLIPRTDQPWTLNILYILPGLQGAAPNQLTLGPDGTIYAATYGDTYLAYGAGTIFTLSPPGAPGARWTYTMLKDFGLNKSHPDSPLLYLNGTHYGSLQTTGGGAVFELQPPTAGTGRWDIHFLHNFTANQRPGGPLILAGPALYGMTTGNAAPGSTVFQFGK